MKPETCAICRRRIEERGESYSVGRHNYHKRCFIKREYWDFTKLILPAPALAEPLDSVQKCGEARDSAQIQRIHG